MTFVTSEFPVGNITGMAFINVSAARMPGADPHKIIVAVPAFLGGVTTTVVDGELQIRGRRGTVSAHNTGGLTIQVGNAPLQASLKVRRSLWQRFLDMLRGRSEADYRVLVYVHPDVRLAHRNDIG